MENQIKPSIRIRNTFKLLNYIQYFIIFCNLSVLLQENFNLSGVIEYKLTLNHTLDCSLELNYMWVKWSCSNLNVLSFVWFGGRHFELAFRAALCCTSFQRNNTGYLDVYAYKIRAQGTYLKWWTFSNMTLRCRHIKH